MWKIPLIILIIPFAFLRTTYKAEALEMFMDVDVKVLPGGQNTCGVLHCLEEGEEPRLSQVEELTIFKSRADVGLERRTRLASVSEQQPGVSRLWDGIKVDGTWSKQKAELTLYLVEKDDCSSANFYCEVHFLNGVGEKRVGSSQLGKTVVSESESVQTSFDSASSLTRSNLQSNALIQHAFSTLESTTRQLHNRLEDKFQNLENRLEDKVSLLDRSLLRLETKLASKEGISYISYEEMSEHSTRISRSLSDVEITLNSLDETAHNILQKSLKTLSTLDSQYRNVSGDNTLKNWSKELIGEVLKIVTGVESSVNVNAASKLVKKTSCTRHEAAYQVILPEDSEAPYLCDAQTEGGGWIVIQRRSTGNVDFYRNWASYKEGFGSLADDFWLGNERIHNITADGSYELMVSLKYDGKSAFAHYQSFSLDSEANNYALRLGSYDGTAGNSLGYHKDMPFTTFDKDLDTHDLNCAVLFRGAWWYGKCHNSNLNGEWGALNNKGPRWSGFSDQNPVTFSEMKIRRI